MLQYITALVKECGELGFKEVVLDQFCYPENAEGVSNLPADRAQVLTDFAERLRAAFPELEVLVSTENRDPYTYL